jgi:hypothetical protein
VNRLLVFLLAVACVIPSVPCGDIFARGAINTQSASGLISIVQFSAGSGNVLSITIITLTSNGMASTHSFCGDQRMQFPVNRDVRVNFTPGNSCDSVLTVVLG